MDKEIEVECPSCSPFSKVLHKVVSTRGKRVIRCSRCSAVQQVHEEPSARLIKLRAIVSYHDRSYLRSFEAEEREVLRVGDEIIVENDAAEAVRITALESRDGVRYDQAPANLIETLWTQKTDRVIVKIAVHRGRTTQSYNVPVEGDREFVIGDQERHGTITRIKVKKGPVLEREGQAVLAKDIQRVYVTAKQRGRRT